MKFEHIVALLVIAGYYLLQWFMLTHGAGDPATRDIEMRALGNADAMATIVLGYYFVSSNKPAGG